jgi:hypothetical protein
VFPHVTSQEQHWDIYELGFGGTKKNYFLDTEFEN